MQHEFRSIPIDQIDIPEDRIRAARMHRVQVLSADIKANGLLQPIGVVEEEAGRFTLVFGLHRMLAVKMLGRHEIDARVQPAEWIAAPQRRVDEVMENLNREGLTALQRMESFAELKRVHEELYPDTANGKNRKKNKAHEQKEMISFCSGEAGAHGRKEIFSFRSEAAERTGLSLRMINADVAINDGLGADVKDRLRGTWLEDHRASLKAMSEQARELQHHICDLMLSTPPQAANVADAIVLAAGRRLATAGEKRLGSIVDGWKRLSERDKGAFLDLHEDELRALAKARGWF